MVSFAAATGTNPIGMSIEYKERMMSMDAQARPEVRDRLYRVFTYQDVDRGPDIPFAHYCDYLEKKRKLIGK